MTGYYKYESGGYIYAIGNGAGNKQISESEYLELLEIIRNRPHADEGFEYRLKSDRTWELFKLSEEDDPELTAEEALDIIVGGGADA